MAAKKSAMDSVRASVDSFVNDLTSMWRDSIMSRVSGAASSLGATRGARAKRQKRDPKTIATLTSKLETFISKNPGKRIEQIGHELSVSTKDLVLSVKKLIGDRVITTRGQRRATAYFPAEARGRRPTKATTRKRKTKKKTAKKRPRARAKKPRAD